MGPYLYGRTGPRGVLTAVSVGQFLVGTSWGEGLFIHTAGVGYLRTGRKWVLFTATQDTWWEKPARGTGSHQLRTGPPVGG